MSYEEVDVLLMYLILNAYTQFAETLELSTQKRLLSLSLNGTLLFVSHKSAIVIFIQLNSFIS